MTKYSNYIELSPHYESVVDIDSDIRNPDMWQDYIVHNDMAAAMAAVCDSLKYEDADKRRSFWIHGAYGTGKSYAAIVLKHLFEDDLAAVEKFLSKQQLIPYRERFLSIRERGNFLVIWKSQTTDIKSGVQLLMTMEDAIRENLQSKFGDAAYYGKQSLITAAKDAVNDSSINWAELFKNPAYHLYEEYAAVDDFRAEVNSGNLRAVNVVARIYREKGWGFFNSLDKFRDWLADIIEGNGLQDTGIIFIWDEFTSYLRNNPTDDVLQPLSEFCKQHPFFMFLIVHKAPGWVSQIGEEIYDRIIHRYHSLDFHVTESAAYELIGSSILTRAGMEQDWERQKNKLMKSIRKDMKDFGLDVKDDKELSRRLRQLCPLHPMTLSLLTIVAQNFGASQRTLFRFMKDPKESEQNVGFIHYIKNFGPDNWHWLTADFLWDYFFTRESDVRNFSAEAKNAYQHYAAKKDLIGDERLMHVFKAAMLLIAVMYSSTVSNLYSQANRQKIAATRSTLRNCFSGTLDDKEMDTCLANLEELNILRLDAMPNGDKRLQLPYSGNADVFESRKKNFQERNTRHELFKKTGTFARSLENKLWDKNSASFARMYFAACAADANSIKLRFNEIQAELKKFPYKFGVLAVVVDKTNQFAAAQDKAKSFAAQDTTGRMAVYLLKSPLTDEILDRWYTAKTHSELAAEEGKRSDADRYAEEADIIVEDWSTEAVNEPLMAVFAEDIYPSEYSANHFAAKLERDIMFGKVFTAAPELIVATNTAFKKVQQNAVEAGIKKISTNAQIGSIVNGLEQCGVWQVDGLKNLARIGGNAGAEAVASAANFLLQKFSQKTQIKLDVLWLELQSPPYGYYNNLTCGYLLGYLLKGYANSEFTWNRGDNNPWPLTEKTLATMITALCKGELVNNYLSPGSEVWRKFKPYAQKIFKLEDGEAVNETEARKYISKQCTEKVGAPFWLLKYLPAKNFGGESAKASADEIVDLFCAFMAGDGDQEQVMERVTVKFTGHGTLRKTLTNLYFDRQTTCAAFDNFVSASCGELQTLRQNIGLTGNDLLDAMHQFMQREVSHWTEAQVAAKLYELCLEYRAVIALNDALNLNRKSIKALANDLANVFANMKVPVTVIKNLGFEWFPTLKAMVQIAESQWSQCTVSERETYTKFLTADAQKVWNAVTAPREILQRYMNTYKRGCTEEDLGEVYDLLKGVSYKLPPADFDAAIDSHLNKISYNRNKERIRKLWQEQSGFDSIAAWCDNFAVPIQWVADDDALPHIIVLKMLEDGKAANSTALFNAVKFFERCPIKNLRNADYIQGRFFAQVGENYRASFLKNKAVMIDCLKKNPNLTADVYTWANKIGDIHDTIAEVFRDTFCAEAKENVKKMTKLQLQRQVLRLLNENPDLYTWFID